VPVYEYRCKRCEGEFEKYVASAGTAVACPACESPEVMRKLSLFGVKTSAGVASTSAPMGGGCCGGGCACH
jgi:putative FmdB family regulatory protein